MSTIQRAIKRGNVRTFDQSYAQGYKSIFASEVDADLDILFNAWNFGLSGDLALADGSVTTPKLADGAVTHEKIGVGAVRGGGGGNIVAGSIVGSNDIQDRSIPAVKLANNAVTANELADGSVSTPKLANGSVTRVKTASDLWLSPIPTVGDVGKLLGVVAGPALAWLAGGGGGGGASVSIGPTPPVAPKIGDLWWRNDPDGNLYVFYNDGTSSQFVPAVSLIGGTTPSGPAGGDLSGTYPNPTVAATAKSKWAVSGSNLTPIDTTKGIRWGSATAVRHYLVDTPQGNLQIQSNYGSVIDDTAKPQWTMSLCPAGDFLVVFRSPPGATPAWVEKMRVGSTGELMTAGDVYFGAARTVTSVLSSGLYGQDMSGLILNNPWAPGDPALSSWVLALNATSDNVEIHRRAPGAAVGVLSIPLRIDGAGDLFLKGYLDAKAPGIGLYLGQSLIRGTVETGTDGSTYIWANHGWSPMDPSKSSWGCVFSPVGDTFTIQRRAPGGAVGALTNVFLLGAGGDLVISGTVAQKASGTTWSNPSDIRIKKNVTDYASGLSEIVALRPIRFEHNGLAGTTDGQVGYGFLANEVEPVMPEMVTTQKAKLNPNDEDEVDLQTLDTSNISLAVVNAIKELDARLRAVEAR